MLFLLTFERHLFFLAIYIFPRILQREILAKFTNIDDICGNVTKRRNNINISCLILSFLVMIPTSSVRKVAFLLKHQGTLALYSTRTGPSHWFRPPMQAFRFANTKKLVSENPCEPKALGMLISCRLFLFILPVLLPIANGVSGGIWTFREFDLTIIVLKSTLGNP